MINIPGIISIVVFYLVILGIGLFAAWWSNRKGHDKTSEGVMLAGRDIGLFVGIFTMTATWVGGGYINGTAEHIMKPTMGLVWCEAPWCYSISLALGGIFFAKKMRTAGYVTMLDPFQEKFGKRMGGLLYIPALLGELFWSGAILAALGASLMVIVDLDNNTAIIASACIAVFYTMIGGLYSVAYTDVVQLVCIFIGLWLSIPFAMSHNAVSPITTNSTEWIGTVVHEEIGVFIDDGLMLIMGGIPWQAYFQRVLSVKKPVHAQVLSIAAGFGCLVLAVPAVLIGAIARSTDWTATAYNATLPFTKEQLKLTLPLVLQYLCPTAVSFVGLGAVSAAVMSSADSSILSASSMFAHNIVKTIFWQSASERATVWVMRLGILIMGVSATVVAIYIPTIYGLWFLCSDLVYCILFPQLVCVLYVPWVNTYGSLVGYLVGFFFRLSGGEKLIHLPPLIRYPWYLDELRIQGFPVKTLAMTSSFTCVLLVSAITHYLFTREILPARADFFRCVVNLDDESLSPPPSPTFKELDESSQPQSPTVRKSLEKGYRLVPINDRPTSNMNEIRF